MPFSVAVATFLLPQEIPLEYYPLNNPSSGLQYMEVTCAVNKTSTTSVFLDTGRGFNEIERIQWSIGPSDMAYTYTFPLPDAPLYRLRFDPISNGAGEFVVTNFRIINRRGAEIRRFRRDEFTELHQIDSILPVNAPSPFAIGWKFVMTKSDHPQAVLPLYPPIFAEGMNLRNLQRCLLSTSYLTGMLWIVLLAVYFAFRADKHARATLRTMAFLLFLSACFSLVGNRGLIRNSVRFAYAESKAKAGVSPARAQNSSP